MALTAAVGIGHAVDGREAGLQAAHQALNGLGVATPSLAFVFASNRYPPRDVLNGAVSLLGDTPLIGFSTPAGITSSGQQANTVTLALMAGDFQAEAHWLTGYAQSSRETGQRLSQLAESKAGAQSAICFADGFSGDAEQFCNAIQSEALSVVGALSGGDLHTGSTFQLSGNQSGVGSMAAAILRGNLRMGIGYAHGWDPVGSQFRITRSRGFWLRTLNGRPASETYADLFGQPASEWSLPPLSYLARLYPLGVEHGDQLLVRSPLRVEADGSFRMNAPVRDGVDAYLLVGSRAACEKAAHRASQEALRALGGLRPAFALVLVDVAWLLLMESHPGAEVAAIRDILGTEVPLAGGYTLGQIVPADHSSPTDAFPRFLNQHLVVVAFADASGQ